MKRIALCLLLLLGMTAPNHALADGIEEFLHLVCIPETRYFEIEYKSVPIDAVDIGVGAGDNAALKENLSAWERHFLFQPHNLTHECRLPDSLYVIRASQPTEWSTGECGASLPIHVTLTRNGEVWLDNVVFGEDCSGEPGILRVGIRDGKEGWNQRNIDLKILPKSGRSPFTLFLSEKYSAITQSIPITQMKLGIYTPQSIEQKLKERLSQRLGSSQGSAVSTVQTVMQRPVAEEVGVEPSTGNKKDACGTLRDTKGSTQLPNYLWPTVLMLKMKIHANWIPPKYGKDRKTSEVIAAVAEVRIGRNGHIEEYRVKESSGSEDFDHHVINALAGLPALPPLPTQHKEESLVVIITFCSE